MNRIVYQQKKLLTFGSLDDIIPTLDREIRRFRYDYPQYDKSMEFDDHYSLTRIDDHHGMFVITIREMPPRLHPSDLFFWWMGMFAILIFLFNIYLGVTS